MDELALLVKGVLADLDGAGALADFLAEHDREREAVLLRRRWKAWARSRVDAGDWEAEEFGPVGQQAARDERRYADDSFTNYIRSRFTPKRKYTPPAAHECQRPRTCCCSMSADEPSDDCPIHGSGEWPPRCATCGRMMKWQPKGVA
jgi:hypothetical protein